MCYKNFTIVRPKLVLSIVIMNLMTQFGAYLELIIYDHKTFIVQVTVVTIINYKRNMFIAYATT